MEHIQIHRNPSRGYAQSENTQKAPENHVKGSQVYEALRLGYQNGYVPLRQPAEIVTPFTVSGIASAMKRARKQNMHVGVRSGGHQWTASGLLEGGMLIDMRYVNREVVYEPATEIVTFGPAVTGAEISTKLLSVSRFFPHGHTPSVAAGGFLLAGGQGWFFRGWGLTSETWILKMEVVTAAGEVVIASADENADLFWAARGCGQGFFGVVTKFWCRTIPARNLFQATLLLDVRDGFETVLNFLLDASEATPQEYTDVTLATFFPEKYDPMRTDDEIRGGSTLLMTAAAVAYADSLEQASEMLSAFWISRIPEHVKHYVINADPVRPTTWDELFKAQEDFVPLDKGERWQCSSILSDPNTTREQLVTSIKPILCNLPTRQSAGCLVAANIRPDEKKMVGSLPQELYVAAMYCWTNPEKDNEMHHLLGHVNELAKHVACGLYVADFNTSWPVNKVMTDSAFAKFTSVRQKWDPEERFQGFIGLNGRVD